MAYNISIDDAKGTTQESKAIQNLDKKTKIETDNKAIDKSPRICHKMMLQYYVTKC